MHRRSLLILLALAALAALGTVTSTASAKEHAVKTHKKFTLSDNGGEYFGPIAPSVQGCAQTNSLLYPGSGNMGGEDIEHCSLSRGETFPANWQTPG